MNNIQSYINIFQFYVTHSTMIIWNFERKKSNQEYYAVFRYCSCLNTLYVCRTMFSLCCNEYCLYLGICHEVISSVCDWLRIRRWQYEFTRECRWRSKGRNALVFLILCPFHLLKSVFIDGTMMAVSARLSDTAFMFYLYIRFHRRFHVVNLLLSNRKRCSSLCFYFHSFRFSFPPPQERY